MKHIIAAAIALFFALPADAAQLYYTPRPSTASATSGQAVPPNAGIDPVSGALEWRGQVPALATGASDCGTSPAIVGNAHVGQVTVGTSTNGGKCTLTWPNAFAFASAPICFVSDVTTPANGVKAVTTTTTLAITATSTITAGDVLYYLCEGYYP